MSFSEDDRRFMKQALRLAARGRGRVEPNPMVGCVVVRDGSVVASGYHRKFGGPHAEALALAACGRRARGADLFVSLEPCCHSGKTPPCTQALIEAGVSRVVAAVGDPFPDVAGKGVAALRRAGIAVQVGLLSDEAKALNAPYFKLCRHGRPWVILKWAQSIDGKIADARGRSQWISSEAARKLVHRWRGEVDAILVGIGTVLADDPLLTARDVRPRRIATRIVLDTHLRLPPRSRLARTAGDVPVLVATSHAAVRKHPARRRRLERLGAEVLPLTSPRGRVDLAAFLDELGERRMTNLLVEGGGEVLGEFFARGLADEARIFVSPRLIGGRSAPSALGGTGRQASQPYPIKPRCVGTDQLYQVFFSETKRAAR